MEEKKAIHFDSPEAATYRTDVKGWVSSKGRFFGTDERTARYDGSTERTCDGCGAIYPTQSYCSACQHRRRQDKFNSFPVEKWDGETPLVIFDDDRFFFDEDDLMDYMADSEDPRSLQLCKCKPGYLRQIEPGDWADDLPEDHELPDAVQESLDSLNAAIKSAGPVAWWEDDIAVDVSDWIERVERAKQARIDGGVA
ncbi:hypothetical protein [Silvibacterium acidisoli]|uniref:hypothetical protein n=1 Tax=Acidobacteriaceae bacterium ZG23-2 TaxID=2883246 RepID=UPI00406C1981